MPGELERKFVRLTERVIDADRAERIRVAVQTLDGADNVTALMSLLAS